jgi:hypothetical protein
LHRTVHTHILRFYCNNFEGERRYSPPVPFEARHLAMIAAGRIHGSGGDIDSELPSNTR